MPTRWKRRCAEREKHGGEVVVITSGPARAQQVLREALAKGADRAIHLEGDSFVTLDAFNTAKAFAAAMKDESFDLVFTGLPIGRLWLCADRRHPRRAAGLAARHHHYAD